MTGVSAGSSVTDGPAGASQAAPVAPDESLLNDLVRLTDIFTPSAVRAGTTHGVFSSLAAGTPVERIAADGGLDLEYLRLLIDFYAEVGVVTIDDGVPRLTATGEAIAAAEPALSLRGMFGQTARSMIAMDHTLATGEITTNGLFGTDFWTALSADDPAGEAVERELVHGVAEYDSDLVRDVVDWDGVGHVIDVGGGRGDLLVKLLRHLPDARGEVLEFGLMVGVAGRHLATTDVAERAGSVAGTYLEPLDARADVFVLSGILSDWLDDDAVRILSNVRHAAAASGGRVILAEITLRGTTAQERLYYRSIISRPVREPEELGRLAQAAGFSEVTVLGASPMRSVLELRP